MWWAVNFIQTFKFQSVEARKLCYIFDSIHPRGKTDCVTKHDKHGPYMNRFQSILIAKDSTYNGNANINVKRYLIIYL